MKRRSMVAVLAGCAASAGWRPVRAQGAWTPLFNGRDLEGWERLGNANWRVEDGAIVADRGNGFLVTPNNYRDFELRAEFWADARTNSGIYMRCTDPSNVGTASCYEVNIWDERPEPRFGTGAIVDLAAVDPMPRADGRWNTFEITARGDAFSVVFNGQRTADNVRDGKFANGRIALQHGLGVGGNDTGVIRFRRVEIRSL